MLYCSDCTRCCTVVTGLGVRAVPLLVTWTVVPLVAGFAIGTSQRPNDSRYCCKSSFHPSEYVYTPVCGQIWLRWMCACAGPVVVMTGWALCLVYINLTCTTSSYVLPLLVYLGLRLVRADGFLQKCKQRYLNPQALHTRIPVSEMERRLEESPSSRMNAAAVLGSAAVGSTTRSTSRRGRLNCCAGPLS